MPAAPRPRHFTTTANEISLREVRAAARQFRRHAAGYGRIGTIRQGRSIRDCINDAMRLAIREKQERANNELSAAADAIDAAITALGLDGYGSIAREEAIRAFDAGRPCVLSTGSYHHQGALIGSHAINRGDADLSHFFGAGDDRAALAPIAFAASLISAGTLRPVNRAAAILFASVATRGQLAA
jgi:hypothetical protein